MPVGLFRDLAFAVRMLVRTPTVTVVAVLALALGIGANTAVFSVVNALFRFPVPVANPDTVAFAFSENEDLGVTQGPVSVEDYLDWRESAKGWEILAATALSAFNLVGGGEPQRVQGLQVTSEFFDLIGLPMAAGRGFLSEEGSTGRNHVAVISHRFWRQRFDGAPVVGTTLTLDGDTYEIVGVANPTFFFPRPTTAIFTPLVLERGVAPRSDRTLFVMGRMKSPDAALASAELETVAATIAREFPDSSKGWTARAETLTDNLRGGSGLATAMLYGSISLVLLIACANVANLLLARATARDRELALRSVLGAGRARLIRQLLVESLLLSVVGGLFGLVLGAFGIQALRNLLVSDPNIGFIAERLALDRDVLVHSTLVMLVAGLLCGIVPALQLSRDGLRAALSGVRGASASGGKSRARSVLVVAEITLALALLGTSGALIRGFNSIYSVHPGFEPRGLLTLQLALPPSDYPTDSSMVAFHDELMAELASLPGVESATSTTQLPLTLFFGAANARLELPGEEVKTDPSPDVMAVMVGDDFFETLRAPVARGRPLQPGDRGNGLPVAVVSEELANRHWSNANPIGATMKVALVGAGGGAPVGPPAPGQADASTKSDAGSSTPLRTVVGVSSGLQLNAHSLRLENARSPVVYLPYRQSPARAFNVAVRASGDEQRLADEVRAAVWAIDPALPIDNLLPLTEVVHRIDTQNRVFVRLLTTLALIALVLATIGIYGVLSFAVGQRTKEIGVRMALGANASSVVRLVLRQAAALTLVGLVLGTVMAVAFVRLIGSQLEGLAGGPASGPLTFVGVALLLLVAAQLASFLPARRAVRVDPLIALRES